MRTLKNKSGWITVACAFVLQGLTHGLGSSMGVFYIQWEKSFPSSSTLISALSTSVLATILCTAPISGAIARRAGVRLSIALGGALAFAGFCMTSFVYRASVLFLTVAVMIGFGSSVVYMASVIAVSNHFTKNFATASGIANAGASVGVLVLPILFEILVSAYDWRGACLVVAAIQLHVFVCMMIIKAPQRRPKPATIPETDAEEGGERDGIGERIIIPATGSVEEGLESDGIGEMTDAAAKSKLEGKEDDQELNQERVKIHSETGCGNGRDVDSKSKDGTQASNSKANGINGCEYGGAGNMRKGDDQITIEIEHGGGGHISMTHPKDHEETRDEKTPKQLTSGVAIEMTAKSPEADGDTPSQGNGGQTPKQDQLFHGRLLDATLSCFRYTLDLFNIRLLWTNPPFTTLMLGFSLGGWFLGTILPHLAARAVSVGISKLLASSLISIIGAGSLVSRCLYGLLVDSGIIHPVHLLFLSYLVTTLSSALVAFTTTYSLLCVSAFGIGIGAGIYIPLMMPLVRSLVGPKDFSGGFGLCLLSVGIGNFLSATFAGLIYDLTQNYTYVFLLPTGVGTLSSLTVLGNQIVWGNWRNHPRWPTRASRTAKRTASLDEEEDGGNLDPES